MDFEAERRRQWEVNVYNHLGFLFNGYTVEETDRGYKSETRDATSIEEDFWYRSEAVTPEIPVIQVYDDIDLNKGFVSELPFSEEEIDELSADGKSHLDREQVRQIPLWKRWVSRRMDPKI